MTPARKPSTAPALAWSLVACACVPLAPRVLAATLPVPCTATSCGNNARGFVGSGAATYTQSGNTLSVLQTSGNATLNWGSFNIGANGRVVFQQPSANAIALNRIYDANPSSIFGALTANGQVFLINANGFLFGRTASVNVGGLIASSLNITDSTFSTGILAPIQNSAPALQQFVDGNGNPLLNTGAITVQAGAQLTAADGGRLLLAAPTVTNAGALTAPDGQIVLAAGQNVYLQASDQPGLRGLIVEVDGGSGAAQQLQPTVSNLAGGQLSAARGNITLVGLAVNQDGRISATTSVSANGSIYLEAQQGAYVSGSAPLSATQAGQLTLGPDSDIAIQPEYGSTATAVDAQAQLPSTITLAGQQILMQGGSINAPSAALTVTALADPSAGVQPGYNANARIRIDAGTTIDLAGSDAELPMAANLLTVQLRSNEFADDPTQRNGALRGDTVTIDMRADGGAGTPIADVSAAIAAVGKNIAQRTETGGTATFLSEGDVVMNPGSTINVSGGATTYLGGTIQTTALVGANGQLYDIGSANPLLAYQGVVNPTFTQTSDKWGVQEVIPTPSLSRYESTYEQGAPAGAIQFAAPNLVLQGSLKAQVVDGPYQRGPVGTAYGDAVPGGTLIIGDPAGAGASATQLLQIDYLSPAITVARNPNPVSVPDDEPLAPQPLQLPAADLTSDGFSTVQLYSNTSILIPAGLPLQLPPASSLLLEAPRIDVNSGITALGGALNLVSVSTVATGSPGQPRPGVGLGDGVTLDVSGQWTNDSLTSNGVGTDPTVQNAGSVALQLTIPGSELVLGNDDALRANGGAWLTSAGALTYGTGGRITLDASPPQAALQLGEDVQLAAFGAGTARGGTFNLLAPRIAISTGSGDAWTAVQRVDDLTGTDQVLEVYAPLFADYGFAAISLTATGPVESATSADTMTVSAGTTVNAGTQSLLLTGGYAAIPSGGTLSAFTTLQTLPSNLRVPETVSLNALREPDDVTLAGMPFGNIDVQAGAAILTGPGAQISLSGEGSVVINGVLRAPGGSIAVSVPEPPEIYQLGYQPDQGIELGSQAVLDVSGTTVTTPNNQGLQLGTVSSGGSVSLLASRGAVVTAPGSVIDIDGASAALDIANPGTSGGYTAATLASAGGSLTVSSPESISLLGSLDAKAGVGTVGVAAAGSLEVDLVRDQVVYGTALPGDALQIELVNTTAGTAPGTTDSNAAVLGIAQLQQSGIDALTLRAGGLGATGDILDAAGALSLAREIILDSPALTVTSHAGLAAPYVQIGNSAVSGSSATVPAAVAGSGVLQVTAQQLNLVGNFALQGVASATLTSAGDVQLQGTAINPGGPQAGSIVTSGNLTIDAARVYPDTYTDFSIQSQGAGTTLTIGQTGASPGTPLSAAGAVSLAADTIDIEGTLLAPFGSINLNAGTALTLGRNSLVSVSGAGLEVPFGKTESDGAQWVYATSGTTINDIVATPGKSVTLSAPNITLQSSATVNIQGGGDLYAYEWVPGTGGTTDALAAGVVPGLYAILPSARGQAAPYDPQESQGISPTATVYLTGGAGLAAGYYALLPARYALEPGADLIEVEPSYVGVTPGQVGALANGTPVIAGYLSTGTTGLYAGTTEYEGFAVYPGSYGQQLAAYTISNASTYFAAQGKLAGSAVVPAPADAGTLTVALTPSLSNALSLEGTVLTAPASGGRDAQVNVAAPDLQITGSAAPAAGSIDLAGSVLQGWNAGSLTLGGVASTDGSTIAVAANSVTIDAGVSLTADQIELVAQQSIDVQSGARLASTSGAAGKTLTALPSAQAVTLTDGSGSALPQAALLAVSDLNLAIVQRGSPGSAPGATVAVEAGSTLSSGGALAVDAPGSVVLAGSLPGKGASWSLSSASIAFAAGSASPDTLTIDPLLLGDLQQAGAVRLASSGAIDLLTPVQLGAAAGNAPPTLQSLTLIAGSLNNAAGGNSTFGASNLVLGGAASAAPSPVAGSGTLTLVADTLTVGPGTLAVSGFAQTSAQVAGAVIGKGAGGINVAGNLALNATALTAAPDATETAGTVINASGLLTLGAPTAPATAASAPTLVGGNLTLSATNIDDRGAIALPSGNVQLLAADSLHLGAGAVIDTAGTSLQAVAQTAPSPGGRVSLVAGGDLGLDAGSVITVAGSGAAPAGEIALSGAGSVTVGATLLGAGATGTGGSFTLDAGQLVGGLGPLAATLTAGGFTNAIDVRLNSGNLLLASGESLTANQLSLTADTGSIDIAGTLSAPSAALRGWIDLSAGQNITLQSGAQLSANGSGSSGRGGEIDLNAVCATCSITLDPGSVVMATGAAQMGQLILRAPTLATSDLVAINTGTQGIGADVSAAGQVIIEPTMVFTTTASSVNSDLGNDIATAAGNLGANGGAIAARLASPGATPVSVQAGVELQDSSAADTLTLNSLDLQSYSQQQQQVVDVSVRAAGAIVINGQISDGYVAGPVGKTTALGTLPSGSFSFVAGADLSSASPLALLAGSGADLTLGATGTGSKAVPAVVRSGSGDVELAAAGNVIFGTGTSAYTAGIAAAAPVDVTGGSGGLMSFGTGGGTVRINAGSDVVGASLANANGNNSVTGWQIREGNAGNAAEYGVNLATFDWNAGALGGGDVVIRAGQDVSNVSAAAADSLESAAVSTTGTGQFVGTGGGLLIDAGNDIGSAQVYVASGAGTLSAGGGLTALRTNNAGTPVGSSIALADAQVGVWARQSVSIDAIYNPTLVPQSGTNPTLAGGYFTYSPQSALTLSSTDGTVSISLNTADQTMGTLLGQKIVSAGGARLLALPANLTVDALQQDIDIASGGSLGTLYPSSTGQLVLFAGRDIVANGGLAMSDSLDSLIPTVANPGVQPPTSGIAYAGGLVPFAGVIHAGDSAPALVTAGGNIDDLILSVPKAAQVTAGQDIVDLQYNGQNTRPADTTLIAAGRDIVYDSTFGGIFVGGPGSLDVLAARNVNLGFGDGIQTLGDLANASLPTAAGANINLMVGYGTAGADLPGFLQKIVAPSATYRQQLIAYVEGLQGTSGLTFAAAETAFAGLTTAQQGALVNSVFFNELLLSGRAANATPGVGFREGYAAIDALFPDSRMPTAATADPYGGNLNLTSSQIYTLSGGNISILVPAGQIDVGLANPPPNIPQKPASSLGIVAEGAGNVDIYTTGDVNVNSSRIFTLGGGNILIWSTLGNIDAGNGSKSSLSVPPPVVLINPDGTISLDFAGSLASGSGIRTIQTGPDSPAGNVDLDAPVGTVNAGDAGIGSAGNINIAAAHVLGVSNINFGGAASGVPSDVSSLGASLSGVSAAASGAANSGAAAVAESNSSRDTAPLSQAALSWLDVFVTGLGEENCRPDDVECLKRQKTAAP